ncbi:hypothetical protein ISS08_01305 [Candidatus Pacearchaeota archaeon]|nr:hypothetical protein [Candidatus Pacearchaeota archaeon]
MYEKKVLNISNKFFGKKKNKTFFILTHKKHDREFYLEKGNKNSLKFIKSKMDSPKKKIIYFLLKLNLLQPFLKKINLNKKMGNLIFFGGQIKSFDFDQKIVYSFLRPLQNKNNFIKSKKNQIGFAKMNFAPKGNFFGEDKLGFKEELLKNYSGKDKDLFLRIFQFYKKSKNLKKSKKSLGKLLRKKLKEKNIRESLIFNFLNIFEKKKGDILFTKLHGDFAKEQALIKNGKIIFTDWDFKEGPLIGDLVNFFRTENNLLQNESFKNLLKLYPKEVQKDIFDYLIVNEIYLILEGSPYSNIHLRTIRNLLSK